MSETIRVRGEGGAVWEMDLPLSPDHQKALKAGRLSRVNSDGSTFTGALVVAEEPEEPADDDGEDDLPPELQEFLAEEPEEPTPAPAKKAAARKAAPKA